MFHHQVNDSCFMLNFPVTIWMH